MSVNEKNATDFEQRATVSFTFVGERFSADWF